jgi:lipopolysaccharide export system protein LptC
MSAVRAYGGGRASPQPRSGRRRRLIDALRILLPLLALVVVGLVLAWPHIMPGPVGIAVPTFVPGDADQPDRLRMDSPRYVGETGHNRPYEVTARSASLDPLGANIVHLDQPAADIAVGVDGEVRLMAQNGTYNRDSERLLLHGGIEVVTSTGYRFVTPSARVNLAQGQIRGSEPIAGEGPAGTLSADRFEIHDAGDVIRFDGRVRVTVLSPAGSDASPDAAAPARPKGRTSS